jgi:hypothetical protein
VALKIERVVDGGMDAEEALSRPGRLEPLHFALSSTHGSMGIFNAIVLSETLLMMAGQPQLPESRSVRAQLIGDQQFRREALLFEKFAYQPQRHALVAAALNKNIEDLAFVIHGAPQIHPATGDPNHHFVEMPSVARAWAALPQPARDHRAKFEHPTPHCFIGDVEPTLRQKFLDVAIAQGEAEI